MVDELSILHDARKAVKVSLRSLHAQNDSMMTSCWLPLRRLLLLHICIHHAAIVQLFFFFFSLSLRWDEAQVTAAECDGMKLSDKSEAEGGSEGGSFLISPLTTGVFINSASAASAATTTESSTATSAANMMG